MQPMPLSPIDYVFTGAGSQPITFAFSYPSELDPGKLQESLARTIEVFPLVQSELQRVDDADLTFHVMDQKLVIEVARSDAAFERLQSIEQYVAPVRSVVGEPLTKIRLTQTPSGSVLAVSMSHALVDGFSFFHFLSSWARMCRGERFLPPHLERAVLTSIPARQDEEVSAKQIYEDCGMFLGDKREGTSGAAVREERLIIPEETIRSEMSAVRSGRNTSVTENDVICAILWKKYVPLWGAGEGSAQTFLTSPFDFRRALAGFPKTYFGCALTFATAGLRHDELDRITVGELALLVKNAVGQMKGEFVAGSMSALENLRKQKGLGAMECLHLRDPRRGMIVTNLTRMPIRDIDFGAGAPTDFLTYVDVLRSAAVLPGVNGVDVLIAHPAG